ncbi:MAG: hypothetical protein KGZ97_11665 [Bacteroidetes bacterium]|nr:hypothetical protein [Bacteroidota bacterium]
MKLQYNSLSLFFIIFCYFISGISYSNDGKISAKRIHKTIAIKYTKLNIAKTYGMKAYYMEYGKIDNKYVSFTDATGLLLSFGHNHHIPSGSLVFANINMRKSKRSQSWLDFLKKNFELDENNDNTPPTDFQPEIVSLLNAFRWFEINGPLNHTNLKHFNVEVSSDYNKLYVLSFSPKLGKKDSKHDYTGHIYINPQQNSIDSVYIINGGWYSNQQRTFIDGWLKVYYGWGNDKCWPREISGGYILDNMELFVTIKTISNKPTLIEFNENDKLIPGVVRNPLIKYNKPFWNNTEQICIKKMQSIEKELNMSESLEMQFINNDNTIYFSRMNHKGETLPKSNEYRYLYVYNRLNELYNYIK